MTVPEPSPETCASGPNPGFAAAGNTPVSCCERASPPGSEWTRYPLSLQMNERSRQSLWIIRLPLRGCASLGKPGRPLRGARTPLPTRHTRSVNARGKSANRAWPPGTSSSGISSLSDGRSPGGGSSLWMIPRSACERPRASSPSSRRSLPRTAPWLRAEVTGWCSGAASSQTATSARWPRAQPGGSSCERRV